MKAILSALLMCVSIASVACLNEHHITLKGHEARTDFIVDFTRFHKSHDRAELEDNLRRLSSEQPGNDADRFKKRNSIAVTLIKLGRLNEADSILHNLYKEQPRDYTVISNLGTLYELQGKNQKALQFIRKAISIEPDSHNGSEWVHVKILEYKLKNIPGKNIAASNILGLSSREHVSSSAATDIQYQLSERIPFTPVPNLLLAKVLDEYAGWLAKHHSITGAYLMYDIATDYDTANILHVQESRTAIHKLIEKYKAEVPVKTKYYFDPNEEEEVAVVKPVVTDPVALVPKKETGGITAWVLGGMVLVGVGVWSWRKYRN